MVNFSDKTNLEKIALFILSFVNPVAFNLNYMCGLFKMKQDE